MTTVTFLDQGGQLDLSLKGHSGYAPRGADIVCAGCSILAYALLNGLSQIPDCQVALEQKDGALHLAAPRSERSRPMFWMAYAGFRALSKKYPDNVRLLGEIAPME